jgi:hypothetical protein
LLFENRDCRPDADELAVGRAPKNDHGDRAIFGVFLPHFR